MYSLTHGDIHPSMMQPISVNLRGRRRGIMVAPTHGVSRWRSGALVSPGSYDMDDEGLGELGFLKKVSSGVKKGVKKVGKVAKKAAPIVIPVAAVALAPFTGGASLAVGAAYTAYTASKKGPMSATEKVGAGILGAGAVGYGAYSYSQTGQVPGVATAKKIGSTVSDWFGSSGGQTQPGAPPQQYPPQTVLQPPQMQQANPLWAQQATRPPVVTYVQSPSYPPVAAQMQTQFRGGGMQAYQDPMELYQEQQQEGVGTGTMVAIGAAVVGGVALVALT